MIYLLMIISTVLSNNNCITPMNLLSSYPTKKSCDSNDQEFVEYMKSYPNRNYYCTPRKRYNNNDVVPITVTKNEIKTITVDYFNNESKSIDNNDIERNNSGRNVNRCDGNTNTATSNNINTTSNINNNAKNDVTVTRFIVSTQTLEKPFTLFREVTTTITVEKPIINYKVTTFTETKTETKTVYKDNNSNSNKVVPKTINYNVMDEPISDQQMVLTVTKEVTQPSILTKYITQNQVSTVTKEMPQSIQNNQISQPIQNNQITTVTVTVNNNDSPISKAVNKSCVGSKCIIKKGCEITMGENKPRTICRFIDSSGMINKKRNRRKTIVKTVYEDGNKRDEETMTKTVFI